MRSLSIKFTMKKKKSFFHLRLERRVNPPPPPFFPLFHFPTAASLTRVILSVPPLSENINPRTLRSLWNINKWRESSYSCAGIDILYLFRRKSPTGTRLKPQFLRPPFGTLWIRPSTECVFVKKCRHDGILKTFFLLYYNYIYDTLISSWRKLLPHLCQTLTIASSWVTVR